MQILELNYASKVFYCNYANFGAKLCIEPNFDS